MTIGDLLDEIIEQVGGDSSDETALKTKLLIDMKSALRMVPIFSKSRMFKVEKSLTHTAGNTTETMPSGLIRITGDAFYEESGDRVFIQHVKNDDLFHQFYRGNATGAPQHFRQYQSTIEFDRQADSTRTIKIPCLASIATIVTTDTWAYTDEEAEIIKHGTKFFYYLTEEDGEGPKSDNFGKLFSQGLDRFEEIWLREEYPDYIQEAT